MHLLGGKLHSLENLRIIFENPQKLRHRPGLRHATLRLMGAITVEDLTDGTDAGALLEVLEQRLQLRCNESEVLFTGTEGINPGVHPGTQKPGPDSALMVGDVTVELIGRGLTQTVVLFLSPLQ